MSLIHNFFPQTICLFLLGVGGRGWGGIGEARRRGGGFLSRLQLGKINNITGFLFLFLLNDLLSWFGFLIRKTKQNQHIRWNLAANSKYTLSFQLNNSKLLIYFCLRKLMPTADIGPT